MPHSYIAGDWLDQLLLDSQGCGGEGQYLCTQ